MVNYYITRINFGFIHLCWRGWHIVNWFGLVWHIFNFFLTREKWNNVVLIFAKVGWIEPTGHISQLSRYFTIKSRSKMNKTFVRDYTQIWFMPNHSCSSSLLTQFNKISRWSKCFHFYDVKEDKQLIKR